MKQMTVEQCEIIKRVLGAARNKWSIRLPRLAEQTADLSVRLYEDTTGSRIDPSELWVA